MNRTDDLTGRLIDGTLTDGEAGELAALLAADPAARARHVALLDVEAALRGLRTDLDFGPATVARIEAERADRTAAAVMAGLADRPAPGWRRPARRRLAWAGAAVAAALLVGVWAATRPRPDPAPAAPEFARVTAVTGAVEVLDAGSPVARDPGPTLAPGQTLRTVGEDSVAVVEFPDHTRIELQPETAVRFSGAGPDPDSPQKMVLVQGQLTATVAGRPAVVAAGGADVFARRGAFTLWSSGPGSVRVESRDGDVRVVRGGPSEPVPVAPGGAAFVRGDLAAVRVESPWAADSAPKARLDFCALDAAFAPDGTEVWAASAKQFVRWPVGPAAPAAPDRTLFAPPTANDGHLAVFTPDRRILATCWVDDKEDRTLLRAAPGGAVRAAIPVRVQDPRRLAVAPDGSWVAAQGPASNRLRVWDAATGRERFTRHMDSHVFCLAATPDGRHLAAEVSDLGRGTNNRVAFLAPESGEVAFALPTRRRQVTALAFSRDGRLMAAGFDGAVQVWDVPGRKLLRTIEGFERAVARLAFDPAAGRVAAGTQDGRVWVWSVATGRRTQVLQTGDRGVRAVAFSPDGRLIVTATNRAPTALWDAPPDPPKDPGPDL